MRRTASPFEDESPFALDELPRAHPFADELERASAAELDLELEEPMHEQDDLDAEAWAFENDDGGAAELDREVDDAGIGQEREDPVPATLGVFQVWQRRIDIARIRGAFDSGTAIRKLPDLVFAARHPGRKAIESDALKAEWHDINDHLVPIALMTGPYHGPIHGDAAPAVAKLRKGGVGAVTSPLAIWPRGMQEARASASMRKVGAVVVHTTGRSGKSKASGYKRPAVDYAVDYYLAGAIGAHYVIDLNGTIIAICDERRYKGHVGWKKEGTDYRKLFSDPAWTPPQWWSAAWNGIAKTPIDLLPTGARLPNDRSIGIEMVPLPDATFTPEQYASLGRLIADIESRYPQTLKIDAVPGKGLLGHEDYSPVPNIEKHRVDARGGKDPGGHRTNPVFSWPRTLAELVGARKSVVRSASTGGTTTTTTTTTKELEDREHDDELFYDEASHEDAEAFAADEDVERDVPVRGESFFAAYEHEHECSSECEHAQEHECSSECEHEHGQAHEYEPRGAEELQRSGCQACSVHEADISDECDGECEGLHEQPLTEVFAEHEVPFAEELESTDAERKIVEAAYKAGERSDVELTDIVFGKRHPALQGGKIPESDGGRLAAEWRTIRRKVVAPVLRELAQGSAPARIVDVTLGRLRHRNADGTEFVYDFTASDLEWTARFLDGEAGDEVERTVVLWIMVNRFAFLRKWKTFEGLLRAYSTPLQYPLNSPGPAYRHWKLCPGDKCRYVDLSAQFGNYPTYKGLTIPKGQLRNFIDLQKRPWDKLSRGARRIAAAVLSGKLENTAGLATEFDDTAVYYRDHDKQSRWPTRIQWREYTQAFAKRKKYVWPSDTSPYDQFKRNVLFVESRFKDRTSPRIEGPGGGGGGGGGKQELEDDESDDGGRYESGQTFGATQGLHADGEHGNAAVGVLDLGVEESARAIEQFGTDEHALLADGGRLVLGAQALVDAWARAGLIDGGAFIDTGATRILETRAKPLPEWRIQVPASVTDGTKPYAGQTLPSGAMWHWIGPDPVYRRPGERWTSTTLHAALLAGEAVALNLGQIVFLAGDLVPGFGALKHPNLFPTMNAMPQAVMVGYAAHDPYAWAVLSQMSPDPHHDRDGIEFGFDDLQRLRALQRPIQASRAGAAVYERRRASIAGTSRPGWAKQLAGHVDLLRKARGPTAFTELHLLAQLLWRKGPLTGREIATHAPWLDPDTRAALNKANRRYDDDFFQVALTSGRYFALALRNQEHFHPQNWLSFERDFRTSLQSVHSHITAARSPHPIPADAVAQLAYGLHFLTDAFSAGHMRVPRDKLGDSGNIASKVMHDVDGRLGLNVTNGFGAKWRAFGDGFLRGPSEIGKSILATLARSGVDNDPTANLKAVRAAVGTAFKQLHYHAQRHRKMAGTDHVRAVLDATRGSSPERLSGDEYFPSGKPGAGKNVDEWTAVNLDARLAYLRQHRPRPLPVGPKWDQKPENHSPLFDEHGKFVGKGFRWATDWSAINDNRRIKISRPAPPSDWKAMRFFGEPDVLDATNLYQVVLNQPHQATSWSPREAALFELFDKMPEDRWD